MVPSIADGALLVTTSPSSFANSNQSGFPTGIIAVDPNSGIQTPVSVDPQFVLPTYIAEGPDGQLYVTDLYATGLGAIFRVDPNSGVATLLASGGYINGPNGAAFVNGYLYVTDGGPGDGSVHNIVRINSQGHQTLITDGPSSIGGGTNSSYFVVPTGMVPGPGDTVYLADEPGGYEGPLSGALWQINLDTGQQTQISSGGFFNHPVDVAVDASGNVIIANTGTDANQVGGSLFKVNPFTKIQTGIVDTFGPYSGTDSTEVGENGTIFVGAIADGPKFGGVLAVNPLTGNFSSLTSGQDLSLVEGMRTYHRPSVQAAPTSTTVTSSLNPAVFGQSVIFQATVTPSGGSGIPTGSVSFFDGATFLNTVALNSAGTASFTTSTLTAGSHSITASYSGDSNFLPSPSNTVNQTINQAATNTTLTSSSFPSSVFGQQVTFTATVNSSTGVGTPTGSVQFQIDNGSPITVGLTNTGTATYSSSSLTAGTHLVAATYPGDSNFLNSGASLTQTVKQALTTTALTATPNPSQTGTPVTFTATISVQSPGTTAAAFPTSTVTLFDATTKTTLDTEPVSTNSGTTTATFSISSLTAGTHNLIATYNGDTNFAVSTSSTWTQTVTNPLIHTSTTLSSSSNNPSVFGQSVTFTAMVAPNSGSGTPTGSVEFVIDNGSPVTISLNGSDIATYTSSAMSVGQHANMASYTGDTTFAGSSSTALTQTVNQANTNTTLTSSPTQPVFGQAVTFTAVVSVTPPATGTPTGSVQFAIDNGTPVKESLSSNGTAAYTISSLTAGTHTVTASYPGDGSFVASKSIPLTQTINQANTNTTLTSSVNPVVVGQTVTFTADVGAAAPGSGTPTGSVRFVSDNGTPVTESLNAAGTATYSTHSLGVGTHTVTASYTGDANFQTSDSTALTQTVNKQAPTTTTSVSSSLNPSIFGQSVTFTATVSPQAGGGTPTGSVQFVIDNGSPLTISLNGNGAAVFSTASLGVGMHTIIASYSGDGNFLPSTSSPFTQTVNPATTSLTVNSSLNPAQFGEPMTLTATVSVQSPGAGTPTGTVQFQINGFNTGSPVSLSSTGTASLTNTFFTLGTQTVTALYSGDNNFLGSSGTLPGGQQVIFSLGYPTTTTVSSSNNPSLFGQTVTFTATVSGGFSEVFAPTGTVQFVIDGHHAGNPVPATVVNGVDTASYSTSSLAAGTHSVQAVYSGDSTFAGSSGILAGGQTVTPGSSTATLTVVSSAPVPRYLGRASCSRPQSLPQAAVARPREPSSLRSTGPRRAAR